MQGPRLATRLLELAQRQVKLVGEQCTAAAADEKHCSAQVGSSATRLAKEVELADDAAEVVVAVVNVVCAAASCAATSMARAAGSWRNSCILDGVRCNQSKGCLASKIYVGSFVEQLLLSKCFRENR